jgi:hypothetical protein
MINLNVYTSLITSVIIQLITAIIEVNSLFIKVPLKFEFLHLLTFQTPIFI